MGIIETRRRKPISYAAETVISSAQNREDVLINRAFLGKTGGFFIDIGAGDPNWDSVTNWFSRRGWTGINIEPNPVLQESLKTYRPKDINLCLGVSNSADTLKYYRVCQNNLGHGWGLSSFDPSTLKRAKSLGFDVEILEIETRPLSAIIEEYASDKNIDFLKIDVEGFEREVIESADWSMFRPRLICVESVSPNSAMPTFHEWEPLLLIAGYEFGLFDGVNSFYVEQSAQDVLCQIQAAVNCNDRYRAATAEDFRFLHADGNAT
jgi:FkbM family methyltransferase